MSYYHRSSRYKKKSSGSKLFRTIDKLSYGIDRLIAAPAKIQHSYHEASNAVHRAKANVNYYRDKFRRSKEIPHGHKVWLENQDSNIS